MSTTRRSEQVRTVCLAGAGLTLVASCYGLARFAYGLFVPVFSEEFGLDGTATGLIASGSYVAYCCAILAATVLVPRWGPRAVAVLAGAVACVSCLAIAAAPNSVVLGLAVLLAGSSTGLASPPLAQAAAETVREPTRDRVQTVVNAGTGVGVAVSGPVALLAHDRWRAAWVAFAVVAGLATMWAARAVGTGSGGGRERRLRARGALAPTGAGRLLVAAAAMGFASSAVWTFGREALSTSGGQGETETTVAWILLGVFGVLGAAAGDLVRRVGAAGAWMSVLVLMAAATVVVAAFPAVAPVGWVACAVFGAVYIAATGILLVWASDVYSGAPSTGVGLAFLMIAVGQAVGSPVLGALAGRGHLLAFVVAGGIGLGAATIRPKNGPRA